MTEVKVAYYPLQCSCNMAAPCDGCFESCEIADIEYGSDGSFWCKHAEYGRDLCYYHQYVADFEYNGHYDVFMNTEPFWVEDRFFNDNASDVVTLEVDGKMLIGERVTTDEAEPNHWGGWISVNECLPVDCVSVLVCCGKPDMIDVDFYNSGYKWYRHDNAVTHWMPLPEPPKEVTT